MQIDTVEEGNAATRTGLPDFAAKAESCPIVLHYTEQEAWPVGRTICRETPFVTVLRPGAADPGVCA